MTTQIKSTGQLLDYKEFLKYSDTFIETGAAAGDGIQRALDAGFKAVLSCEAADKWHQACCKRFAVFLNVNIFKGKSINCINRMMMAIEPPGAFVIFLDAHPTGPESAGHKEWESGDRSWDQDIIIKAELAIILTTRQQHVIIIDDVNGLADGHAMEYCELIEAAHPGGYDFAFYDENLSGTMLYIDKILVAKPKQ